jgi:hypothetical protein
LGIIRYWRGNRMDDKEKIVDNFVNSYIAKQDEGSLEYGKTILLGCEKNFSSCGSIDIRLYTTSGDNKGSAVRVTDFYTRNIDTPFKRESSMCFNKHDIKEMLKHLI